MARPRTTFEKLQKERARQEKQAAKRARRQGTADPTAPSGYAAPMEVTHFGMGSDTAGTDSVESGVTEPAVAEPGAVESS